jgi:hypothetical protein
MQLDNGLCENSGSHAKNSLKIDQKVLESVPQVKESR